MQSCPISPFDSHFVQNCAFRPRHAPRGIRRGTYRAWEDSRRSKFASNFVSSRVVCISGKVFYVTLVEPDFFCNHEVSQKTRTFHIDDAYQSYREKFLLLSSHCFVSIRYDTAEYCLQRELSLIRLIKRYHCLKAWGSRSKGEVEGTWITSRKELSMLIALLRMSADLESWWRLDFWLEQRLLATGSSSSSGAFDQLRSWGPRSEPYSYLDWNGSISVNFQFTTMNTVYSIRNVGF